jgi:uncharacterized protein with NAD-binding domain and iron-sulfur cluster
MAIVVEDGSGKGDSNSYVDIAEAEAYATARGVTLQATESKLILAMDYLEAQRARYQGEKTWPVATTDPVHVAQALQWPRTGVVIDCDVEWPDNAIPVELKRAQMQYCIELQNGFNPFASSDGRVVKKTKVDVIEKEFFSATDLGISGIPQVSLPAVDALLSPLFNACGTGGLKTVRV